MRSIAISLALSVLSATAFAATRTETLKVFNMTCASCPYIVRHALLGAPGVSAATVSYADKTATVTFDDAKIDIAALVRTTTDAGYPSEILK
ncbi:MAG: mercury resistance system periplasmic binding protein MerP [Rhodospirillales bacterium]|nr:mercury resistance system periplasmic binding protein MerP [Rhodospirillales bacterium]